MDLRYTEKEDMVGEVQGAQQMSHEMDKFTLALASD